ncbi:DotU family type IV/VI secretion system protein [Salmonella enterica]|uniref:DotU family type IV/VI secretion system protein n=1 Tax=Salmonella enterica TaxID=28901 RepID=UPI0009AE62C4|nr:DotU family type IV/VI secretion system protein [Salmonella enterica]ECC2872087.1 DotU family type IV/VI secretion system protein [Salmonella enterica subsp. enterica serovar Tanger]EDS4256388.1 DotU family type IV/VI secretion system protein [Salmonella enterica subsp. enterica serovar Bredeney]EDV0418316.1 DotU family type IV/VI secretion system protein [Salmonella enterica subsp. enterica serovar Glostrup]EDV0468344.1 DotU family type IV/VI secretion system protein [Salmonella enterica su
MHLLDCYIPVFYRVLLIIQQGKDHTDSLRETILSVLVQAQDKARQQGYDEQDIEEAHFAVLVWVDEVILCAEAERPGQWHLASLQQMRYDSALGGQTFFERLNTLPESKSQVRLVYLFCLLCGFRGRFDSTEDLALNHVIQQQIDCLPDNFRQYISGNQTCLMLSPYQPPNNAKRNLKKILLRVFPVFLVLGFYSYVSVWLIHLGS